MSSALQRWAAVGVGLAVAIMTPVPAAAWWTKLPPRISLAILPANQQTRPVAFTRFVYRIAEGTPYQQAWDWPTCITGHKLNWRFDEANTKPTVAFANIFRKQLVAAGFKSADPDAAEIFGAPQVSDAEYEVGAVLVGLQEDFCQTAVLLTPIGGLKGAVRLDVEWQVYSRLQGKVVAKIQTSGGAERTWPTKAESTELVSGAFEQNVMALLSSKDFVAAVSAAGAAGGAAAGLNSSLTPIYVAQTPPSSVADSTGSVVAIFAGDGFGSGWVVADGYLLTDRHVVGDAAVVRIKWSDQLESQGAVLRSDARRDVALIKTDTRDRPPLPVRFDPLTPGETVFAIGTPLDPTLQNTVTRGVVSAHRTIDGFAYIQSDVMVNHGNSGGPLLDETGRVVGLAESGIQPGGAPAGLNLFTPVRDAFDFLQLKLQTKSAAK